MTYVVSILRSAQKSLAALPPVSQDRLITAICRLAANPRLPAVKKLTGCEAWRIRKRNTTKDKKKVDVTQLIV